MKWKEDLEIVTTDDPYYDMLVGGSIDPNDLLEPDDAKRVKDALELVMKFYNEGMKLGYIEEC